MEASVVICLPLRPFPMPVLCLPCFIDIFSDLPQASATKSALSWSLVPWGYATDTVGS